MSVLVGPFYPDGEKATIYCALHDEAAMTAAPEEMSERERELYQMLEAEYPIYSASFLAVSEPLDTVFLYEAMRDEGSLLAWHTRMLQSLGLSIARDVRFHAAANPYRSALSLQRGTQRRLITACYSRMLSALAPTSDVEAASRVANSKIDLARSAESFAISLPNTILFAAHDPSAVAGRYSRDWQCGTPCVVKADGLGGGCNVSFVTNEDQLRSFCSRYDRDTILIAQDYLSPDAHREYVVEGAIYAERSHIHNIREKIIIDGQWRGTIHRPNLTLPDSAIRCAHACFNRARALGYCVPGGGLNCSIDCAVMGDETYIFEMNARLTSGLPVSMLIKKLALESHQVISYLDTVHVDDVPAYCEFVGRHLYSAGFDRAYGLIPVSVGARSGARVPVWLAVAGSLAAFVADAKNLPPACMSTIRNLDGILKHRGLN